MNVKRCDNTGFIKTAGGNIVEVDLGRSVECTGGGAIVWGFLAAAASLILTVIVMCL